MIEQVVLGSVIVAASLVTMNRAVSMPKLLGFAAVFDIVFAVSLFEAFGGSFSGLIVSAMAGLQMAIALSVMRHVLGYQKLHAVRKRFGLVRWKLVWVDVPAKRPLRWRTAGVAC